MKRSSTPSYTFTLPFVWEKLVDKFILSYASKNGSIILEKTESDVGKTISVNGATITVVLSQEETNLFSEGEAFVQLKVLTTGGNVLISDKISIEVENVLNDEVFE